MPLNQNFLYSPMGIEEARHMCHAKTKEVCQSRELCSRIRIRIRMDYFICPTVGIWPVHTTIQSSIRLT